MICGIVGVLHDENKYLVKRYGSVKGIGKTMFLTWLCALDKTFGRRVITNYTTCFTEKMTLRQAIEKIKEENIRNATLGMTEFHQILSNYEKKSRKEFYSEFIRQIRKYNINLYWDSQLEGDINKTMRNETDFIWTTEKYHKDNNSLCVIDICERPHYIKAFKVRPEPYIPLPFCIDCEIFGQMYNTREILVRE